MGQIALYFLGIVAAIFAFFVFVYYLRKFMEWMFRS